MYYVISVIEGFSETIGEPYEEYRDALAEVGRLMLESRGMGIEYYVDDAPHNQISFGFDVRTI